ncbi:DNA primase [Streptomyces sp. H51]|uniref:DNA primase n=1 Tax=Streptomyces sp. H51 TaxID=3111770 RepID=UPI002D76D64C|nr:DNA primase [Streptomyces sp. H51]
MNRVGMGLAVGAGYLLGRTKKLKMAFAIGSIVAGKRMNITPRAVADLVSQQLLKNPQFKEIGTQLRTDLRGVGKAASGAMVERQIDALADRLHGRTGQVRDQLAGVVPGGGRGGEDEEPTDEEEPEAEEEPEDEEEPESEEHEEPDSEEDSEEPEAEEDSEERGGKAEAKRAPEKRAAKRAPAKKAPAKKAPAKKTAAKKTAPAKKAAAKKTATAKKTAGKKTAAARGAARGARGRMRKGGGDR